MIRRAAALTLVLSLYSAARGDDPPPLPQGVGPTPLGVPSLSGGQSLAPIPENPSPSNAYPSTTDPSNVYPSTAAPATSYPANSYPANSYPVDGSMNAGSLPPAPYGAPQTYGSPQTYGAPQNSSVPYQSAPYAGSMSAPGYDGGNPTSGGYAPTPYSAAVPFGATGPHCCGADVTYSASGIGVPASSGMSGGYVGFGFGGVGYAAMGYGPLGGGPYPYTGAYGGGLHARYPYYSYRAPWYYRGPAGQNVTIHW